MRRLEKKVALITGGASGLGKAIAERFALEGAEVMVSDIDGQLGVACTERGFGFFEHDVCNEGRWVEVIGEVERRCGRLDILVNNAGIVGPLRNAGPEDTSLTQWRQIFAVNVEGVFLGCKAAIPALRRSGEGAIINMSSTAALQAVPDAMAYGASKAAVRHLTRSIALYCARNASKIRCNSVHPGNVRTPLLDRAMSELAERRGISYQAVVDEFRSESPQGDFQTPEDVANAVLFLASDESKHVTGMQFVVDGGITLSQG